MTRSILSVALIAATVLTGAVARAGTLTATGMGPLPVELTGVNPRFGCTHRFNGPFEAGDADRIIAEAPSLLCLDSPGGLLTEALHLTAWMKDNPLATKVERGATCESACALVFMAGNRLPVEGRSAYFWRVLEPGGRLGFHAPGLFVQDGNYSKDSVERAYGVAMQSVAQMIADLAQREDLTGKAMTLSLMQTMFATPTTAMRHVETVDDAGRWGITVGPLVAGPLPGEDEMPRICTSAQAWANDLSAQADWLGTWTRDEQDSRPGYLAGRVLLSEISSDGCTMWVDESRSDTDAVMMDLQYEGGVAYAPIQRLDPMTRLDDLPYDPTPAEQGTCVVRREGRVLDEEPCTETRVMEGDTVQRRYAWPSGSVTVLEYRPDDYFYINGRQTYADAWGPMTCWTNVDTGNEFCFDRP